MHKVISYLLIIAIITSCSALGRGVDAAKDALIDCAKADISKRVREDGPTVLVETLSILQSGGAGWRDALSALAHVAGEDALACAVESARAGLEASGARQFSGPDPAARARTFASERGWKFAK